MEKDYQIAIKMYKQYQNDVAKVGNDLNPRIETENEINFDRRDI